MDTEASDLQDKIHQQFDWHTCPWYPLEHSPKGDANALFIHNLVTPYYLRNQNVIDTTDKIILDVECDNGYTSLILAEANPGATIVGIDLSEASIQTARERLKYHQFKNVEFHVLSIYDVQTLGLTFDYINCDETLYLLPNLHQALQVLKSVLKPEGIIRGNLHSLYTEAHTFRAQKLFKLMGLMDSNPEETEIETALQTIQSLKDDVPLKASTWSSKFEGKGRYSAALASFLQQEDKGFTIPDLFAALRVADLEFISMVNWRLWEPLDLFQDPENLPLFWAMNLPDLPDELRLHVFELMCPVHRLLDFWCGHPNAAKSATPVQQWQMSEWQKAKVHLHPQLVTKSVWEDLVRSINDHSLFTISQHLSAPIMAPVTLNSFMATCLLPLWEGPQPIQALVSRWLTVQPLDPITLEPRIEVQAFEEIKSLLTYLETYLYVLLELPA
ncbi:class I SAM-dependent methyltransferase [Leptothermofonsia sp. ETS-13]|uniref:class I SAM-dependent methyltransferase n=1 Tax=Leptothermofonsia sp. ETS-13 TaxID=3035696 RepID=UPI003B9F4D27